MVNTNTDVVVSPLYAKANRGKGKKDREYIVCLCVIVLLTVYTRGSYLETLFQSQSQFIMVTHGTHVHFLGGDTGHTHTRMPKRSQ